MTENTADLRGFLTDNPEIGDQVCSLMIAHDSFGQVTIFKDMKDAGVPAELIWTWTATPNTNRIDLRRLAFSLYEHCWGVPARNYGDMTVRKALLGAKQFIVDKLVRHLDNPVPCATCGAGVGELCEYFGKSSHNKHDARMEAIQKASEQEGTEDDR